MLWFPPRETAQSELLGADHFKATGKTTGQDWVFCAVPTRDGDLVEYEHSQENGMFSLRT